MIGSVLIGGAALTGGDGNVYGTFIGAAILGMVTNGLVLLGFPPASGLLASGAIIVVAGIIDVILRRAGGTVRARRGVIDEVFEGDSRGGYDSISKEGT